jgi:hypothetical protein
MIIIDKNEQKYYPGLEDGFIKNKPFIYSIHGNLIIHPDDCIGVTDDGSKYIADVDETVLTFRHKMFLYLYDIESNEWLD